MKRTAQANVGHVTICKSRNEMGSSPMKRKSAVNIARRIKSLVSRKNFANSITDSAKSTNPIAEKNNYGSGSSCFGQALIHNYLNFRRSATPSRFMFFRNDAWTDFSGEVFGFLKAGFVAGMPVVDCSVEGSTCLFDFLRMLQFDSATGRQRSIAWIDVNGRCFFPKLVVGEETNAGFEERPCPKLEIEIRIEKDSSNVSDKSSNSAKEHSDENFAHSLTPPKKTIVDKPCIEPVIRIERPKWPNVEIFKEGDSGYMDIENIFLSGIGRFTPDITITSICRCLHSGPFGNARLKVFQNQVALTQAARGNANVKLAWYETSAEGMASVIEHGFGQPSRSSSSSEVYGVGVYLSPQYQPYISASVSSADSNGENHVMLCRVIVGNAEKVEHGSLQFHPSSEQFDCGVDDLVNPRRYIVWSTHMNRHILPEYVVSFKSPDQHQGLSRNRTSSISPNVAFQKLLSEMEKCLSSSRHHALERLYTQYKVAKISKDSFVRQIRLIAGDKLLMSTIRRIRSQ